MVLALMSLLVSTVILCSGVQLVLLKKDRGSSTLVVRLRRWWATWTVLGCLFLVGSVAKLQSVCLRFVFVRWVVRVLA